MNLEEMYMFLAELSKEGQKAFLNLAVALIKADGKVTQEELNSLNMYKAEIIGMSDISEYGSDNIGNDIKFIAGLDVQMRKKVYFELISLAYTDSDYSDDEKKIIDNLESVLTEKARKLYHKCQGNPDGKLSQRCCNFTLLEEKSKEYNKKEE